MPRLPPRPCLLSWHSRRFQARPGSFLPVTVSSSVSFQFSAGIWRQGRNGIFYDVCSVQEQGNGSRGSDSTRDLLNAWTFFPHREIWEITSIYANVYSIMLRFPLSVCRLWLQPNLLWTQWRIIQLILSLCDSLASSLPHSHNVPEVKSFLCSSCSSRWEGNCKVVNCQRSRTGLDPTRQGRLREWVIWVIKSSI